MKIFFLKQLSTYNVAPSEVYLEITESAYLEGHREILPLLKRLSEQGVRLAIDDSGTGYSSFRYLQKLPVSRVKIDKSFVQNMHSNPDDRAMVLSMIEMSKKLGYETVVEGIEQEIHLQLLKGYPGLLYQGYYYSKPIDEKKLIDLLDNRKN